MGVTRSHATKCELPELPAAANSLATGQEAFFRVLTLLGLSAWIITIKISIPEQSWDAYSREHDPVQQALQEGICPEPS